MAVENSIDDWVNDAIKAGLRRVISPLLLDDTEISPNSPIRKRPIDQEKIEFVRRFIASLRDGRHLVAKYNYILLAALVAVTTIHWGQKLRDRRRQKQFARSQQQSDAERPAESGLLEDGLRGVQYGDDSGQDDEPSSSSSTLQGAQSPARSVKAVEIDLERQPLLGGMTQEGASVSFRSSIVSWMMYQPGPIPVINRTLPSNGTSLLVLCYFGVNVFLHLFGSPWSAEYFFFIFADKGGCIFIVNLPLLYILAAKNQPLKFLTGYSYEALNIFHRRVGELMCFEAVVHTAGMLIWETCYTPEWLSIGTLFQYLTTPLILLGIGAFASYELLYFTSLGSFRQRWYEMFLVSHVFLQVSALVFLYLHFRTSRPYVIASLSIFVLDRLVWRLGMRTVSVQADVQILEDGNTLLLSADWDIPRPKVSLLSRWLRQSVVHGWEPMDHVFITVPVLGRTHSFQTHPFTIASAAPTSEVGPKHHPTHAWLSLLIRAQSGFTSELLHHARSNTNVSVRLDGPYGSHDTLEMLRACDSVVLIAGGSGIAVVFSLVWALVQERQLKGRGRLHEQQFHLLWITHSRSHRSWLPQERLDELAEAGVQVTIPEPTIEVGRPDVDGYVTNLDMQARSDALQMGVVVSGPDNLNRTARNACSRAVRYGGNIRLRVEKFGW